MCNIVDLVLYGDLVRHMILEPINTMPGTYNGVVREAISPLLPEIIERSFKELKGKDEIAPFIKVLPWLSFEKLSPGQQNFLNSSAAEIHTILELFPRKFNSVPADAKVLRIKKEYLLKNVDAPPPTDGPDAPGQDPNTYLNALLKATEPPIGSTSRDCRHLISVVYDRNSLFRKGMVRPRPAGEFKGDQVYKTITESNGGLLLAITDDISADWLDNFRQGIMDSSLKADEDCFQVKVKSNSVAVVSADALRKCGLPIMEYGSIETTIRDVAKYIDRKPLCNLRDLCGHLVVIFRETGGLHIDHSNRFGSFSFCPNFDHYVQATPERFGAASGKFTIITAAIIREMCRHACFSCTEPLDLAGALRLGTAAYNMHFRAGYTQSHGVKTANGPLDSIRDALGPERREYLRNQIIDQREIVNFPSTLKFYVEHAKNGTWRRYDHWIESCGNNYFQTQEDLLIQIALRGLDHVFRDQNIIKELKARVSEPPSKIWWPEPIIAVPYAKFGAQKLVDWHEIEQYSDLAKLIRNYFKSPGLRVPLSIAVFGQPGSGKSFAVKQILQSVSPDRKSEPLTFNLAQFNSIDQLTDAFHKVQDQALALDETPLVIFDEFDCTFSTKLGWLKYFLAPMQDGIFRGRTEDYRIGRAIFLFSGGTSHNFSAFIEGLHSNNEYKLGDFVSRLRGFLDVGNINPTSEEPDRCIELRRVILLRSLLELHAKPIMKPASDGGADEASIDDSIVRAFLHVKEFRHGVRSMEAIIQMSRWINYRFLPASLPAQDQLSMHVDDSFGKFIGRD
jgi:hypothetical protein